MGGEREEDASMVARIGNANWTRLLARVASILTIPFGMALATWIVATTHDNSVRDGKIETAMIDLTKIVDGQTRDLQNLTKVVSDLAVAGARDNQRIDDIKSQRWQTQNAGSGPTLDPTMGR